LSDLRFVSQDVIRHLVHLKLRICAYTLSKLNS
jgi:hypothetical protein